MARKRRGKSGGSRRNPAVNLIKVGSAILSANIVTNAAFNTDAWTFAFAGTPLSKARKTGQGTSVVTAYELITWGEGLPYQVAGGTQGRFEVVGENLKENGLTAIISLIALGVGEKVLMKATRPLRSQANRLLKMGGLERTVKF
jgi:hypothetical protein